MRNTIISNSPPKIANLGENIFSVNHILEIINEDLLGKVFLELQVKQLQKVMKSHVSKLSINCVENIICQKLYLKQDQREDENVIVDEQIKSKKNYASYMQKRQKLIDGTPKRNQEMILPETKSSLIQKKKEVLKRIKFLGANFEAQLDSNNEFKSNVFEFYSNFNFFKQNKKKVTGAIDILNQKYSLNEKYLSQQNALQTGSDINNKISRKQKQNDVKNGNSLRNLYNQKGIDIASVLSEGSHQNRKLSTRNLQDLQIGSNPSSINKLSPRIPKLKEEKIHVYQISNEDEMSQSSDEQNLEKIIDKHRKRMQKIEQNRDIHERKTKSNKKFIQKKIQQQQQEPKKLDQQNQLRRSTISLFTGEPTQSFDNNGNLIEVRHPKLDNLPGLSSSCQILNQKYLEGDDNDKESEKTQIKKEEGILESHLTTEGDNQLIDFEKLNIKDFMKAQQGVVYEQEKLKDVGPKYDNSVQGKSNKTGKIKYSLQQYDEFFSQNNSLKSRAFSKHGMMKISSNQYSVDSNLIEQNFKSQLKESQENSLDQIKIQGDKSVKQINQQKSHQLIKAFGNNNYLNIYQQNQIDLNNQNYNLQDQQFFRQRIKSQNFQRKKSQMQSGLSNLSMWKKQSSLSRQNLFDYSQIKINATEATSLLMDSNKSKILIIQENDKFKKLDLDKINENIMRSESCRNSFQNQKQKMLLNIFQNRRNNIDRVIQKN